MGKLKLVVYWCRRDFRLLDNPAFFEAVQKSINSDVQLLPLYILDSDLLQNPEMNIGYPRKLFLSRVLAKFSNKIPGFCITQGSPEDVFSKLLQKFDCVVYANEDVEPYARKRDQTVAGLLKKSGSALQLLPDQLTIKPDTTSGSGGLYSVFTPFKKSVWSEFLAAKAYPEIQLHTYQPISRQFLADQVGLDFVDSEKDLDIKIFNKIDSDWILYLEPDFSLNLDEIWPRQEYSQWYFTEEQAWIQAEHFLKNGLMHYDKTRDFLDLDAQASGSTSRLSLALKWGLISPRSLVGRVLEQIAFVDVNEKSGPASFLSELVWREFYKYIIFHHPEVITNEYQAKFRNQIRWAEKEIAKKRFEAWLRAKTGYELVDAAMHQIAVEGWQHNRARMLVGSVLSKNFGVDWRWGQAYFQSMLLDCDEASNNGGWQWAASTGADPKPIRIFNPYLQSEKYDKNGTYRSKWLGGRETESLIIEHPKAREEALKRYGLAKDAASRDF